MMSFSPYIGFFGTAREAMSFYAKVFGATDLQLNNFSDLPADQRPPGSDALVMHAQFSAGPGAPLMGCDIPPGMGTPGPGSHSVFHGAPDVATATRIFADLSEGGAVEMPLAPTFWSPAFGMVKDRYGTRWMISVPGETP
jgi:PhnB protein